MKNIGARMKEIRIAKKWAQSVVAHSLQISIPAYSKIETNITDCSVKRIQQIADIFNVPIKILIEGDLDTEHLSVKTVLENKLAENKEYLAALKTQLIALYEELRQVKIVAT